MIALDTIVPVRIFTNDFAHKALRARALVMGFDVFVETTVLLKADWMLRTMCQRLRCDVASALRAVFGLPRVTVEAGDAVVCAMTWADEGMDIADALHPSLAADHEAFPTFDRALHSQGGARAVRMVSP